MQLEKKWRREIEKDRPDPDSSVQPVRLAGAGLF
jgi:hypothetical protein